jgi:hypothetical protein
VVVVVLLVVVVAVVLLLLVMVLVLVQLLVLRACASVLSNSSSIDPAREQGLKKKFSQRGLVGMVRAQWRRRRYS